MRIAVVYESMFGNTKTIGDAIAEGVRGTGDVVVGTVDDLPPDEVRDADLIVAGGPTQNRGMAKPDAHRSLAEKRSFDKYGTVLPGRESLAGWLEGLPNGSAATAAFDTRLDKPMWLTGSAAKEIASRLSSKGYDVVATESFLVRGTGGPLMDGERERAVAWGRELAANVEKAVPA
jgi:hypothetical protein